MTVRDINLVVPLAGKATDMHNEDTADGHRDRSSAVSPLIGQGPRRSDVDSTIRRSTPTTPTMRGVRTSETANRTTTTRTTSSTLAPSADQTGRPHTDFSFTELVIAYFDCRQNKRNSKSALRFERNLENNLRTLYDELIEGRYQPGQSICFIITDPKPREVWAADFRDRIVHHLLHNRISPRFHASFIADSCACIPCRGTLYAAQRLEKKVRSITQNWGHSAYYLKCDLANFFVSIDKAVLHRLIIKKVTEPWWRQLTETILFHDPRDNYTFHGSPKMAERVPSYKRLINQSPQYGLPIGNLSSQFFANIYLDALDKFIKHQVGAKYYIRYVDDFVLLHHCAQWLNNALIQIEAFLETKLNAQLNPKKTILQPIHRGIDFVGQVIKPWHRVIRKKTRNKALKRIKHLNPDRLYETANSYYGLLRQASHSRHDRIRLSRILLQRGFSVNGKFTKTYKLTNRVQ